jgi:hypothetical protein
VRDMRSSDIDQTHLPLSRTMRIVAAGRRAGHGFSFEPAGLKTSTATVLAGAATKRKPCERLCPRPSAHG